MNWELWREIWASPTSLWLMAAAALAVLACGAPGTFLVVRRMSLAGDAISHSVLPGIVVGFLVSGSLDSPLLLVGAALSGWLAVMGIGLLARSGGVREDAATGIVFTAMFALGVVMLRWHAGRVDLDPDCVLFGNLETAVHGARTRIFGVEVPDVVVVTGGVAVVGWAMVGLIYHRLLAGSFDPALAALTGQSPGRSGAVLLGVTALVVVAAFQAVGAVMSVALLVLPAASGLLLFRRLPAIFAWVVVFSAGSTVGGMVLATWWESNLGAAVVLAGAGIFCIAWVVSAARGRRKARLPIADPHAG